MSVIRIRDPQALRPSHVVMIVLVAAVVGASSLLLSAAESATLVDGAVEWREGSVLRSVVQLLCLNYNFPTINAGEVKNFVLGLGAGLAAIVLGVAVALKTRVGEETSEIDDVALEPAGSTAELPKPAKAHVAPLLAAQVLAGLYLLWSFASSRWSAAPELAFGGSILLAIYFLWAFAIGNILSAAAGRIASRAVIIIMIVTSLVAIWYYYGRNPVLRAKFPYGNPIFLAACMIPGILLLVTYLCERIEALAGRRGAKHLLLVLLGILALGVALYAFDLSGSRGPLLGLGVGVLAVVFFAVRGKAKLVPVLLAVVVLLGAYGVHTRQGPDDKQGRGVTLRVREYAWSYAMEMFMERRLRGHGQGGFVLAGDSHAVKDVVDDPLAFTTRIAHAHNEWLEVLADLGSIGLVLVGATLVLTLRAGMVALSRAPPPATRWALVGLMGALVGLSAEECFGVGLRVSGVPTMFYTVLGLIWAMAAGTTTSVTEHLSKSKPRRALVAIVGCLLGLMAVVFSQQDFAAARDTYRIAQHLANNEPEEAIAVAASSTTRLNPQRALGNLFYLCQAHARSARMLQISAMDRQSRAQQTAPPDSALLQLAGRDYAASNDHCEAGSQVLGKLVSYAPGFPNHGLLEYQLNQVQAFNAAVRGDTKKETLFLSNAAAALERELRRQPINVELTAEYVRVVGDKLGVASVFEYLARPLRHNRIGMTYLDLLLSITAAAGFDDEFHGIEAAAKDSLRAPADFAPSDETETQDRDPWAPEKLRLAATIHFFRADYAAAEDDLRVAADAYEGLASGAPMGAAGCYSELADARFFSDPNAPREAIESAERALELAPESEAGRDLKIKVEQRLIAYHLAMGSEAEALAILRRMAPAGTGENLLAVEIGLRYASLAAEMLRRRPSGEEGEAATGPTLPFADWFAKATRHAPDHPQPRYVAALWAWSNDDEGAALSYMLDALQRGLPLETALDFVYSNLRWNPDSPALLDLLDRLDPLPPAEPPPYPPPEAMG
jgi:O-antigen ligase/tetratricopeptide (TPR) repeat protein